MDEVERRIIDWIVQELRVERKNIHTHSTIAGDVGVEGDDAVEFFEKFAEQFNVDLTTLKDHWHLHFLPEGGGGLPPGCMVVIAGSACAGYLLHLAFLWIPAWMSVPLLAVVGCAIYWQFFAKYFGEDAEPKRPITVGDLVNAASAGRWLLRYNDSGSPERE